MKNRAWLSILICAAVGLAIALPVAFSRESAVMGAAQSGENRLLWQLSDGCFVAGLLLTGFGALTWISTTGFFDIFNYGFKSLLVLFTSFTKPERHKKYYEYKLEKEEHRAKPRWYALAVGLVFIAAALVLDWVR